MGIDMIENLEGWSLRTADNNGTKELHLFRRSEGWTREMASEAHMAFMPIVKALMKRPPVRTH